AEHSCRLGHGCESPISLAVIFALHSRGTLHEEVKVPYGDVKARVAPGTPAPRTMDRLMADLTAPLTVRSAVTPARSARQHIRFAFYRVRPEWRLRSATERAADREEVAALVRELGDREGVLV